MLKLIRSNFSSYTRIKFLGLNTQKILNIASQNKIVLKNVVRTDYASLEADVSAQDVKRLKRLVGEEYKCISVKRKGVYYSISTNKNRICLFASLLLAVATLITFSNRIFVVRVHGYENEDKIVQLVKEAGMVSWRQTALEKAQQVKDAIIASDKDILWSSISVKGSAIDVYIKKDNSLKIHQAQKGKLVASKDCVIKNLVVTSGTGKVENGQLVSAGQTLIEGKTTLGETEFSVPAEGKALASVWYFATEEIPLTESVYEKTGNVKTLRSVKVFGMTAGQKGNNSFEHFVSEQERIKCFFLPVEIIDTKITETKLKIIQTDRESATREAESQLKAKLLSGIPSDARLFETKTLLQEQDGMLKVSVYIETIENVAVRG